MTSHARGVIHNEAVSIWLYYKLWPPLSFPFSVRHSSVLIPTSVPMSYLSWSLCDPTRTIQPICRYLSVLASHPSHHRSVSISAPALLCHSFFGSVWLRLRTLKHNKTTSVCKSLCSDRLSVFPWRPLTVQFHFQHQNSIPIPVLIYVCCYAEDTKNLPQFISILYVLATSQPSIPANHSPISFPAPLLLHSSPCLSVRKVNTAIPQSMFPTRDFRPWWSSLRTGNSLHLRSNIIIGELYGTRDKEQDVHYYEEMVYDWSVKEMSKYWSPFPSARNGRVLENKLVI